MATGLSGGDWRVLYMFLLDQSPELIAIIPGFLERLDGYGGPMPCQALSRFASSLEFESCLGGLSRQISGSTFPIPNFGAMILHRYTSWHRCLRRSFGTFNTRMQQRKQVIDALARLLEALIGAADTFPDVAALPKRPDDGFQPSYIDQVLHHLETLLQLGLLGQRLPQRRGFVLDIRVQSTTLVEQRSCPAHCHPPGPARNQLFGVPVTPTQFPGQAEHPVLLDLKFRLSKREILPHGPDLYATLVQTFDVIGPGEQPFVVGERRLFLLYPFQMIAERVNSRQPFGFFALAGVQDLPALLRQEDHGSKFFECPLQFSLAAHMRINPANAAQPFAIDG